MINFPGSLIPSILCCGTMLASAGHAQLPVSSLPVGSATARATATTGAGAEDKFASYERTIPGSNVSFAMVAIPGGKLYQGTNVEDAPEDEQPAVEVEVSPFWIGKYEVTWAEYKSFMNLCGVFEEFDDRHIRQITEENKIDAISAPSKIYDPSFTFQSGEDPRLPAVSMSQYAAKQYTKWLSLLTGEFYRLPTESEWEYACRAGSRSSYCFGDDANQLEEYAWFEDNADYETHLVGQKLPNAWGLYDMHGNAAEWTLDQYRYDWYEELDRRNTLTSETSVCWPDKLFPRVLRGGSMYVTAAECRCSARRGSDDDELRSYDPDSPKSPWWFASDDAQDIGFRIVRPLKVISREEQERYWKADVPSIQKDVKRRIEEEGRGKLGIVDPQLPQAIEQLHDNSRAQQ